MGTLDLRAARDATDPQKETRALIPRERVAHVTYHEQQATVMLHAPTGDQRTHIDRMAATLAGVVWERLSPRAQARFHALATFAVCVADAPPWMEEAAQEDDDLLFALAGHVEAHASAYFRRADDEGGEGEGRPWVVVALADL